MRPDTPWHVTGVDEITRHDDPKVKCSSPVVIVSSTYVPSALAVNAPVTASDPVIGAEQPGAPTSDRSSVSLTVRHEDATCQVPTTSPAQGDTLAQTAPPLPPPPLGELPPEEVPPVCGELPVSEEHARKSIPRLVAKARAAARTDELVGARADNPVMSSTVGTRSPL